MSKRSDSVPPRDDAMPDTVSLLNYSVYRLTIRSCVLDIHEWVRTGRGTRWLACLNPHSYAVARGNERFASALRDAEWLVADGVGVVLASRVLGRAVRERVTGAEIFEGVCRALDESGGARVYFVGSTNSNLQVIRDRLARDYPRLNVVGTLSPPFTAAYSDDEIAEMVSRINEARPDVVWVGMTAPKQELWTHTARTTLDARFVGAIGAVFDFYSGKIKRSHPAFQHVGLEWLPRLIQEPRRLWRRTCVSAPVFMRDVLREAIRMRIDRSR
jgi:N-acetylglucosaminyldiphosphoundecaprenol N-acetyl-beta-D-mannosaminyltransferase